MLSPVYCLAMKQFKTTHTGSWSDLCPLCLVTPAELAYTILLRAKGVNQNFIDCQANLEMSYSYQSRSVLFSDFRFYGVASLIWVNTKLETSPPGMVS